MQKLYILLLAVLGALSSLANSAPPTYSGTLPVMFINTDGGTPITSKDTYLQATYYLDPMGVEGVEPFGTAAEPLPLQIKGRGNYTWTSFDKKPYRLKLDKKASLLGMQKSKHFALLAHADDGQNQRGFLRNPVGFELGRLIGMAWTPAQEPVEVVLNGEYIGLYFLTETIRVDKDRVDITEQPDMAVDSEAITGGWLVEIDNYDTDPHIRITEGDGERLIITYKSPEVLSSAQSSYLTNQMTTLNNLIYGDTSSDDLWQHLDIDQLARFYIVQEVTCNFESFHGSCYLYKDKGADARWTFGPLWDFGCTLWQDKNSYIYQGGQFHQSWIGPICRFPAFNSYVQKVWHEFTNSRLNDIYAYIDTYSSRIAAATQADAARWPAYGIWNEAECARVVKQRVSSAQTWLNNKWGTFDGIDSAAADASLSVYGEGSTLYIVSGASTYVDVTALDGRNARLAVAPGSNAYSMQPGFYIVAGKKIFIR